MGLILVLILIAALAGGGLPQFGFHDLGYWPSGTLVLVFVILIMLAPTRRL